MAVMLAMSVTHRGDVLVCFPGAAYTQSAALDAARKVLGPRGWKVHEGPDDAEQAEAWVASFDRQKQDGSKSSMLYLMDYDLIPFESVNSAQQSSSSKAAAASSSSEPCISASSYPIRKALIRKNWLHTGVHSYSVKNPPRELPGTGPSVHTRTRTRAPLEYLPKTWSIDVQFADDLDELLIDELYDLEAALQQNDQTASEAERRWFILKAGMADRGMGIRMFDSLDGLRAILEDFEEDSDDEADQEGESEGENASSALKAPDGAELAMATPQDTSVMLGQLRHFVIQVSNLTAWGRSSSL